MIPLNHILKNELHICDSFDLQSIFLWLVRPDPVKYSRQAKVGHVISDLLFTYFTCIYDLCIREAS